MKKDAEIDAMSKINDALNSIPDNETRFRVLSWANNKFGNSEVSLFATNSKEDNVTKDTSEISASEQEIPGIATISENGNYNLTIRDLKAQTTNDAAIRLSHIVIYTHQKLTDSTTTSSKKILKPILEQWRAYTGSTRWALKKCKGIIREGDLLSLDIHAKRTAEKYIQEILDDTVVGTWDPHSNKKKVTKKKSTTKKSAKKKKSS